jgi:L-rhamnose-H+ transport protein
METLLLGIAAIVAGGLLNGTFAYPMKLIRQWNWENIWFLFCIFGLLLLPAVLAFATIDGLWRLYAAIPTSRLIVVLLLGLAWGAGSLLFGLGISALGFSLGYAIVMGTAAVFGTVIPALALGPAMLANGRGAKLITSLGLILIGLALCTIAGRKRENIESGDERAPAYHILSRIRFRQGLPLCFGSGLLSACFNIGFAQATDIIGAAQRAGASAANAGFSAWALIMSAGAVPGLVYCGYLFFRNGSFKNFLTEGRNWLFALVMGCLWIMALRLYGTGAQYIGARGATIGWPIMTSSAIIGASVLGVASAEWRGVPAGIRAYLYWGIVGLIGAVVLAGMSGLT